MPPLAKPVEAAAEPRRLLFPCCVALVGALVVTWLCLSPVDRQRRSLQQQVGDLQAEVEALWRGNVEIEYRCAALRDDPAMIEREARRQLGYGRPGEVAVRLPLDRWSVAAVGASHARAASAPGRVRVGSWARVAMALLAAVALFLFLYDLRLPDTGAQSDPG